jgi:hypothetical protein
MGCWAIGSFGNDDAADWLYDLAEQNDLSLVKKTITQLLLVDGYLDASYATEALAAIEVIAAALSRPTATARANEDLMGWIARVKQLPEQSLVADAIRAVDRILAPESELRELWEDTDEFVAWQADVADLRAQLVT